MRALDRERPLLPPFSLIMRLTGLEVEAGQHLSSFLLHGGVAAVYGLNDPCLSGCRPRIQA